MKYQNSTTRYLSKIVFINSAHVPYSEIKLDGNVHFIGTQGVGKSTLLRALLFFYNADKLKLGIPPEKKGFDTFYFPYANSYIIYEVMRETGAYCIMTFKYLGRAAYRFIDAPYDRNWFINEGNEALSDWFAIRERIGKEHSVSAIVTVYETFRDIIFGNNRRQELISFRKYAIVESNKYQNIPRTIQNVFLNSKLDADFIKDTIIRSLTDEEISIDLDTYRRQTKEFEQEYSDVMLWYEKNKSGEIPVRKTADKVVGAYRDLIYVRKQIADERAELNYAERISAQALPKKREEVSETEERKAGILKAMSELEQKRAKERDELNMSIGRVDSELKRASMKRQEYEKMDIEEIVRRVEQEPIVEKEMEGAQALKRELTRAYEDIMAKYRQLIEAEEVSQRSFENGKTARILAKQGEAAKRKEEALNALRAEEEAVRKASAEKEQTAEDKLQQLREEQSGLRQRLVKLEYEKPYSKETSAIEEELLSLDKREPELRAKIHELQTTVNGLRQECEMKIGSKSTEYEKRLDEARRKKETVTEAAAAIDSLTERRKGSFAEWLEANVPEWEETIGKIADEETVLYNGGLNPHFSVDVLRVGTRPTPTVDAISKGVGGSLFGVEIDLRAIERDLRSPEQLKGERERLQEEISRLTSDLIHISEEKEAAEESLKKRYTKQIRELSESQHLLEAELSRMPQKRKNLRADLSGLETKAEEQKRKQRDNLQDKLNENGRQIYLTEEGKKRLAEERERQLKTLRKRHHDRESAINAETEQTVAVLAKEVEERKKLSTMRIHGLASDRDSELSGKGGDMDSIRKADRQIEDLRKELDYIREHRAIVTYYIKDKQELFDREPQLKNQKKELEEKLSALDARYSLRNERHKIHLNQVNGLLAAEKEELKQLKEGLSKAEKLRGDAVLCPPGSMDVGEKPSRRSPSELVDELKSLIVSSMKKADDFRRSVNQFTGYFSSKNTFNFRTELVSEEDYLDFASNLCEFIDNNKIADFQKQISSRYTTIIRRLSQEVGNLTRNRSEISKTISAINSDFVERNFSGVIKEISLRQTSSSDKLMQLLLEIKKFTDENEHNMGEADLFTTAGREEVNSSAVRYLLAFMKCLVDDESRSKLQLTDTFNLEFRVKENDNDTGWVEKIANVGSDGTDILVKAMVNIMLINVFKEKASRKFGDFKLHCMMDEIGKLHPSNVRGILEFANCRNILLVNGSPTTYNASDYKHTYLLTKDKESNTRIVPLISHE